MGVLDGFKVVTPGEVMRPANTYGDDRIARAYIRSASAKIREGRTTHPKLLLGLCRARMGNPSAIAAQVREAFESGGWLVTACRFESARFVLEMEAPDE